MTKYPWNRVELTFMQIKAEFEFEEQKKVEYMEIVKFGIHGNYSFDPGIFGIYRSMYYQTTVESEMNIGQLQMFSRRIWSKVDIDRRSIGPLEFENIVFRIPVSCYWTISLRTIQFETTMTITYKGQIIILYNI